MIKLIVAMDDMNGIGINNRLPWYLPQDLKHFKDTTMGHHVVMGRKTADSISGIPLKGRKNSILTRNPRLLSGNDQSYPGFDILTGVDEVIHLAKYLKRDNDVDTFVIGGDEIFKQFINHADIMHITQIHGVYTCSKFFPSFSNNDWKLESKQYCENHSVDYSFLVYNRKNRS